MTLNQRRQKIQHTLWQVLLLHRYKRVPQFIHRAIGDGIQDLNRPR
jgi:hypothetical protein